MDSSPDQQSKKFASPRVARKQTLQKPLPRKRRLLRRVIVVLLIFIVIVGAAPFVAAPFVRDKIEQMVSDHLHGQLEIGSLSYSFPYGVTVHDASFVTDAAHGSVKVLSVKELDLSLAKLPFREGPIVVRNLSVIEPIVHVIRQKDGTIFGYDLPKTGRESPPAERKIQLSDVLQLHRFDLQKADIVFEDQTAPNELPLQWHDITAHLKLEHKSKSNYGFAFSADNQPVAHVELSGSADLDSLKVTLDKLAISAAVKPTDTSSPLPAQLQSLLRKFGVAGAVNITASGDLPVTHPTGGQFTANVSLKDVAMHPIDQPWSVDQIRLNLNIGKNNSFNESATQESASTAPDAQAATEPTTESTAEPSSEPMTKPSSAPTTLPTTAPTTAPKDQPRVNFWLTEFDARGMGGDLHIPQATATLNLTSREWRLQHAQGRLTADDQPTADATTAPATTSPTTNGATKPSRSLSTYLLAGKATFNGSARGSIATPEQAKLIPTGQAVINFNQLTLMPPGFVEPLRNVSGTIRLVDRAVLITGFTADCGNDHFEVKQALIPLTDPMLRIQVRDIIAVATFGTPMASYPPPINKLTTLVKPAGRFDVSGAVGVYLGRGKFEPDYAIQIYPRDASATLTDRNLPISNLNGEISVAPRAILVPLLSGKLFDGTMTMTANALPIEPFTYQADIRVTDVDLGKASTALNLLRPDGTPKISGRARSHLKLNGSVPGGDPIAGAGGHGFVRIADGDLWSLQLFSSVVDKTSITKNAVTVGDAAAVFDIKDKQMQVTKLAVSSSTLGVQGEGTIGLVDQSLDFNMVVAPLGDWRQRIRDWKIPLVGDVVGQLAGTMQKVVNTTTSSLLYQFRVKGTLKDPKISAIPAPILTDGVARIFGTMLKGTKSDTLGEEIGAKD